MEHFTEKEVEQVVCEELKSFDIKVTGFSFERVNEDSFMGDNYRLLVNIQRLNSESVGNYFAKFLPSDEDHRLYVKSCHFFEKEAHFFCCIVPQIDRCLPSEINLPFAHCYFARGGSCGPDSPHYWPNDDESVLIFEDLYLSGYTLSDRWEPMDLQHCRLVLRALANLHGGSMNLRSSKGRPDDEMARLDLNSIKESILIDDENHTSHKIFRVATTTIVSLISRLWPHRFENDVFCKRMLDYVWGSWKSVFEMAKPSPTFTNAICHGWMCASNLMFVYERATNVSQTPVEVKLIHMQYYRFAPPATDILFFLHVCTSREFRNRNMSELLSYYHTQLSRVVSPTIVNEILPMNQFVQSVQELKLFGVVLAMFLIPMLLVERVEQVKRENGKVQTENTEKTDVMDFLLTERSDEILKHINEFPEFRNRLEEPFIEYLEMFSLMKPNS